MSAAVGKTTHRVTSKSKTLGKGPFSGVNISERNEERDLLTEDEAGRLGPDEVIVLANGQHPIKARRIKYFEDRRLKSIFAAQDGPLPAPDPRDAEIRDLRGELVRAAHRIDEVSAQLLGASSKRGRSRDILPAMTMEALAAPKPDTKSPAAQEQARSPTRRRRALMALGPDALIVTDDEAVKALLEATEKVRRIQAPP